MLTRLFQWLKRWLQRFFGSKQTHSFDAARSHQVVDSLPELTNADLELLFIQMLQGVHEARGKQWVLMYLQRMENRITVQRWVDWLFVFGEKLLNSPAPNHQLATRMVQLGELNIGIIGDMAYDIGIRLLTRNLGTQSQAFEQQQVEAQTTTIEESLFNTPGQELLGNLGEQLWDYNEQDGEIVTPPPKLSSVDQAWTGNLEEVLFEYQAQEAEDATTPSPILISSEDDGIVNLFELLNEAEAEAVTSTPLTFPTPSTPEPEERIIGLFELLNESEAESITSTPEIPSPSTPEPQEGISGLFGLLNESEPEPITSTPEIPTSPTSEQDERIARLFGLFQEPEPITSTPEISTPSTPEEEERIARLFALLNDLGSDIVTSAPEIPTPSTPKQTPPQAERITRLFGRFNELGSEAVTSTPENLPTPSTPDQTAAQAQQEEEIDFLFEIFQQSEPEAINNTSVTSNTESTDEEEEEITSLFEIFQQSEPEVVTNSPEDLALPTTAAQEEGIAALFEIFQQSEPEVVTSSPENLALPTTAAQEEGIAALFEIFQQSEPEVVTSNPEDLAPPITAAQEEGIAALFEIFQQSEPEVVTSSPEDLAPPITEEEDERIIRLFGLLNDLEPEVVISTPEIPTPPTAEEEEGIALLFELLQESSPEVITSTPAEKELTTTEENADTPTTSKDTWDTSLAKLEPKVADTLDELLVRLDQSSNLVQELASELATYRSRPQQITQGQTERAQSLFYQGLNQAKTGDLLGAIALYNQAIKLQPNSHEYWFNRGLTLFHLQNFTEAIASYEQAIKLKPNHYKAWYNRGGILGQLGQFEAAITSFDQAIAIKPDYPESWSSKGLALLKLGQIWEAISSYDQALRLEPEDQESWYYRGIALGVGEQYEDAISSYDKALEIQPDYYEVWIDRGVVLFNLGRWSDAITSWDNALSIQADFYLAWYNRGVALDNLGQRQEAIASYNKAIAIKPDFHLAWYNQAVALFYLGRFSEAIACYDSALQIKLDYWEAWIGRGTAAGNLVNPQALRSLFTTFTAINTALKQVGYEGKLASLEEGLKYVRPDTHPEGWGRLHLAMGNTYWDRGKKHSTSRQEWEKALVQYNQALLTLTKEDFPQLHLEVLQSLVKVHIGLGEIPQAQQLYDYGIDLLQQLLSETTLTDESKKQLGLKFAGFGQLGVDLAVNYGDLVEAWEMAEQGKNACLTWLLYGWHEQIDSPNYRSIQQLLNPTTAIIYWHISPTALNTFILKDATPSPILLFTPIQDIGIINLGATRTLQDEFPLPEAVRRLIAFEDWLEDWNQKYQEYRQQPEEKQNKNNHSWQEEMEQKLLALKHILNISTIEQELEDITQLILIPHRDLHKLPLHALFKLSCDTYQDLPGVESNLSITYLPSVQIALTLKTQPQWDKDHQLLLNIEYPHSKGYPIVKFAKLQAQVVSEMFTHSHYIAGALANKKNVENALFHDYNILHFMGNVINNYIEPKKSEFLLAGEDKLTLEEICQQTLVSYNLATLSACETNTNSNQIINSEYVSFVSGLMTRGVCQVVSTLWTVESFATALVIIEFYRRLQPDKTAATALAEATAWLKEVTALELTKWYEDLLNNLNPEELRIKAYVATELYKTSKLPPEQKLYSHPYYWAAFIITGKPN